MNAETSKYLDSKRWRQFYRAAIFENNISKLPQRVTDAQHAIVVRARELFDTSGDHCDEQEALEDAMYALHALETSWRHRFGDTTSTSAVA